LVGPDSDNEFGGPKTIIKVGSISRFIDYNRYCSRDRNTGSDQVTTFWSAHSSCFTAGTYAIGTSTNCAQEANKEETD